MAKHYNHLDAFLFLFKFLFSLKETEQARGREREGENPKQEALTASAEPDVGFEPTNCEIMT